MTDEMLALARENQRKAGVENVEWLRGEIEAIPLPAETVDVVISNCVINLSGDKPAVLAEAARVLKPGGRLAVSDVIADEDMDAATRADIAQWTGCIAGALTRREFEEALATAGFVDDRGLRDPPGPRQSRLRDHPRPQALAPTTHPLADLQVADSPADVVVLRIAGRLPERSRHLIVEGDQRGHATDATLA